MNLELKHVKYTLEMRNSSWVIGGNQSWVAGGTNAIF